MKPGSARAPAPVANRSPFTRPGMVTRRPSTASDAPVLVLIAQVRCAGNSRVWMSTLAPAKSPGWSGVKVFTVVIVWSRPVGKRSSGTTFFSGSGLGIRAPLSEVCV